LAYGLGFALGPPIVEPVLAYFEPVSSFGPRKFGKLKIADQRLEAIKARKCRLSVRMWGL